MRTEHIDKLEGLEIYDVHPVPVSSVCPYGGIGMEWASAKLGWGQYHLFFDAHGKLHADTEHMDNDTEREFSKKIFALLAQKVVIDE